MQNRSCQRKQIYLYDDVNKAIDKQNVYDVVIYSYISKAIDEILHQRARFLD